MHLPPTRRRTSSSQEAQDLLPRTSSSASSNSTLNTKCADSPWEPVAAWHPPLTCALPPALCMQIVNLDKIDYCSSLKNLNEVSTFSNYKFIKGNLLSADLITYILEQEQVDTIIHAAAQARAAALVSLHAFYSEGWLR